MSKAIVDALERELADLEGEVLRDPRHEKIRKIKDLLATYGHARAVPAVASVGPVGPDAGGMPPLATHVPLPIYPRPGTQLSKANQIKRAISNLFEERGPQHRVQILEVLIAKGLMGHEKKPIASLAAYLSSWSDFASNGDGQWYFAPGPRETPSPSKLLESINRAALAELEADKE